MKTTPLNALHRELNARMVDFAGYNMPVQYQAGILKEHQHTREAAGLFDVSHMGQIMVSDRAGGITAASKALEALIPIDILSLSEGRQRYGFFINDRGGIEDDLMVANLGDRLLLVVNAANQDADLSHINRHLPDSVEATMLDRALVALQGPKAEAALARLAPAVGDMRFLDVRELTTQGVDVIVSRSGYTGEDGFEISVQIEAAETLARQLLDLDGVEPVGLGARDSLRLEAGLPLCGSDLDATTSPVEAGLIWAISKTRRPNGERAGGYPGADRIARELEHGPDRIRIGLKADGRAPVRAGARLYASETAEHAIGTVTSGGFGPTVGGPVAMAYVESGFEAAGAKLFADVRGRRMPMTVVVLPFIRTTYKR